MQGLAPVPSHTDALMRSTLAACAAVDVNRVGAVLEVIRRVVVRAASSFSDHSSSVLVSPHT
jgi:hypothetical protein